MKRYYHFFTFIFILMFAIEANAQTWSNDIATMLYQHCTVCHHQNGLAPFSLMTYAEASNNAIVIKDAINTKKMPPWMPNADYCHFKGENILSDAEIQAINAWIDNGTPTGNLAQAPTPPSYNNNSLLSTIDDSYTIPPYTLISNTDEHRIFVFPNNYAADKYLSEIEFIPGAYNAVHHIVLYQDTSASAYNADLNDPLPGVSGDGTFNISETAQLLIGWLPGGTPFRLPLNIGFKVPHNSYYVMEIHYAPNNQGVTDSTKFNLRYANVPAPRIAKFETFYPTMLNPPLIIPADSVKTFYQIEENLPNDISLLAIYPHAHLICKDFKVYNVDINNDTLPLIHIPKWDFHWQSSYTYRKMQHLKSGSDIMEIATYDNTSNNLQNPNNPPQTIYPGAGTNNEMMICVFAYTEYQQGDENIILDSTLITNNITPIQSLHFTLYPNPANDKILLSSTSFKNENLTITIFDMQGKSLYQKNVLFNEFHWIEVQNFPKGIYMMQLDNGQTIEQMKWIKE